MDDASSAQMPWGEPQEQVISELTPGGIANGLGDSEVAYALQRFGENALGEAPKISLWVLLLRQLKSLVVVLLVAAAILSGVFGDWIECGAIIAVIAINSMIGFVIELKAVRSMDALRRLTEIMATVRRNGSLARVNAKKIVPGDVVLLEAGDVVPADMRLVEASQLQIDEAALTGESVPVEKHIGTLAPDTLLAERANMAFKSCPVTRGTAIGVVTATGTASEIGQISSLVAEGADEDTPLDRRLDALAGRLVWVTLVITIFNCRVWDLGWERDLSNDPGIHCPGCGGNSGRATGGRHDRVGTRHVAHGQPQRSDQSTVRS